jgi:hypothetical protein
MTQKQMGNRVEILIDAKLKTVKRGKKHRADWEKSIEKAEVHIGL